MASFTLQGYINTDWTVVYYDIDQNPINDCIPVSSSKAPGNGFSYSTTSAVGDYPYQGSIYQAMVLDTCGNQIQYRDNLGYLYNLNATLLVASSAPVAPNNSGGNYTGYNQTTITLWGQYFTGNYVDGSSAASAGGVPSSTVTTPTQTTGSGGTTTPSVFSDYGYYAIWVPAGTGYIPIDNPEFVFTTSATASYSSGVSTYDQCTTAIIGGLVAIPSNNTAFYETAYGSYSSDISYQGGQPYDITCTAQVVQAGDLDATTNDTNLFSNTVNNTETYTTSGNMYYNLAYSKNSWVWINKGIKATCA